MISKEIKVKELHDRVRDLERQLAEARSALEAASPQAVRPEDRAYIDERLSRALFDAPYPIMIRRSDGRVLMINAAWTRLTGYTLEDIPTLGEWTRKAYGEQAEQRQSLILKDGFAQMGVKRWGEFEVRTSSGDIRIWDFSSAPLGFDEQGRELVMVMTVDVTHRRQAEDARAESDERFSKAFRKAPFSMNITRWRDDVILDVNDAWLNMLGWKREEILGKSTAEFPFYARPRDREIIRQRIMNDENLSDLELHLVRKNGTKLTVTAATTLIEVQGERSILSVLNDITDRKQAEEALRESEHRYRELFETMQEGLVAAEVITDENFKPIDYRYLNVNPATERHLGISREQFVGRTYTEVLPEGDPEWIEILGNVALTGQPAHVERYDRASHRWFEAHAYSPRAGQFINIFTDITERKEAEQALKESEQKFSIMFDKAPFTAALSKPPTGAIININAEFERVFGYSRKEATGKTSLELGINPDAQGRERILAELQAKGSARNIETMLKTKSGEARCFLLNIDLVYIAEEQYILQTAQDITERKQAEERIREISEFPLQNPNPIMRFTRGGELLFANPAATRLLDLWKQPDGTLALPNAVQDALQKAAETQANTQIEIDESQNNYLCLSVPVPNTNYINLYFSDITERKKVDDALRQSDERFSKAFHASPDAIIISRLSDGLIIEVNEGWNAVFGHSAGEVLGHTSFELGVFAYPDDRLKAIALLKERGSLRDFELQIRRKSGEIRDASLSVELIEIDGMKCMLTVVKDITERKKAEHALRESEQRFHSLADSMPQLVWTALPDGRVDYYNRRHQEYHDIRQVNEAAWEWAPVLHADDVQPTVDAWQHSVSSGEVYEMEHRVRMVDGSYRWHLSRGVPMFDEQGRITRWFGTATDIHDQKEAQEAMKDYAGRLERSNRELEQFAFIASHDLQEPLRKIQVFGDLLADRARTLDDRELEYVERMRNAAGRMREMIDGLLHLSRINTRSEPFTDVDLSNVTAEALSDLAEQVRRSGGNVEVAALPRVTGDPLQIRQLMQNLIGNALKYHKPQTPPNVRVHARQLKDAVQILVEDEGIGFEQEYVEQIFQPFQRLVGRSEYEGSGMGLAICRKIVERHGGTITAQSKPGEGTTCIVTLPIRPPHRSESEHNEYKTVDPDR